MTLQAYQKICYINEDPTLEVLDKSAWTVCHLYGYTEKKVNDMHPAYFLMKLQRAGRIVARVGTKRRYWRNRVNTDATAITLGQFIEVVHWLKGGVIQSLHLIAATMRNSDNHKVMADKLLKSNARNIVPYIIDFIDSFNKLLANYSGLFESDSVADPDAMPEIQPPFVEQYGWIYSATQVAQFEGLTLDQAYMLPVIQALNDLAYLKSKQKFDEAQRNK